MAYLKGIGACGIELWIADELWRLAHKHPHDYDEFVRTVARMVLIAERKQRRGHRTHAIEAVRETETGGQ